MNTTLIILACLTIVFIINLVPAFMPASWMVMSFFYIEFEPPLLILTVLGAIVSGLGRLVLARESVFVKRRFMHGHAQDLDDLGQFLKSRGPWLTATTFIYSLLPLPTNNLFVAAGLAEVRMLAVIVGFWAARIPADTFFVWSSDQIFSSLGDVFRGAFGSWLAIAFQLLGVTSVILLYRLPWARWLNNRLQRHNQSASASSTT